MEEFIWNIAGVLGRQNATSLTHSAGVFTSKKSWGPDLLLSCEFLGTTKGSFLSGNKIGGILRKFYASQIPTGLER